MSSRAKKTETVNDDLDKQKQILGTLHHKIERASASMICAKTKKEFCRRFLRNIPCCSTAATSSERCKYVHPDHDTLPICKQWELYAQCSKNAMFECCWFKHPCLFESEKFTVAFHTSTVFGLRLLERMRAIFGEAKVTVCARESLESVCGCVIGLDWDCCLDAVRIMKELEPHGLAMCSRIYKRCEESNMDQTLVDKNRCEIDWRKILMITEERFCRGEGDSSTAIIKTVRFRCFPKELEKSAYATLDELIAEDLNFGLTGPGKGICARKCDLAIDCLLIQGRLHVSSWDITADLDLALNQSLIDAEERRKAVRPLCRAFFKMEEAISRFDLGKFITSCSMVVDVGCAPGGWIQAFGNEMNKNKNGGEKLSLNNKYNDDGIIFAVDPAKLGFSPPKTVEAPKQLVHLQKKIEDSVLDIEKMLNGRKLGVVACDGNSSPLAVYRWVSPLFPLVDEENGVLVLTMKNFVAGKRAFYEASAEVAEKIRNDGFEEAILEPLFANSTEEMTLVAFRKKRNILE